MGEWTLSTLAKWANAQGLTTPPMRRRRTMEEMLAEEDEVKIDKVSRPVNVNTIHRILTSRFYIGKVLDENGQWVDSASHEKMFDEELFNEVQKVLKRRRTSIHYVEKIDLPDRGLIRCLDCGRVYSPYVRKGILYFNARCTKDCANSRKNFNSDFIEAKVGELISKLSFTDKELEEIDNSADTDVALLDQNRYRCCSLGSKKAAEARPAGS